MYCIVYKTEKRKMKANGGSFETRHSALVFTSQLHFELQRLFLLSFESVVSGSSIMSTIGEFRPLSDRRPFHIGLPFPSLPLTLLSLSHSLSLPIPEHLHFLLIHYSITVLVLPSSAQVAASRTWHREAPAVSLSFAELEILKAMQ